MERFAQDLRYGMRQLRQSPGFTAVAVLSLALGIGANTAIFQLVDAIRLRSLPVKDPQTLVMLDFAPNSDRSGWFSSRNARFTYTMWEQIRNRQEAFSGVLAWSATRFDLTAGGESRFAEGLYVSGNFFRELGVNPIIGRTFTPEDDTSSCPQTGAVISYAFWQRELGGEPGVLGRTLRLNGQRFPVIGVTPPSFFGVEVGRKYDVAVPLCVDRLMSDDGKGRILVRHAWWLAMMGRLKPGWTVDRANSHMVAIAPAIMQASLPETYQPHTAKKFLQNKMVATQGGTGISGLRRQYERPLWLLMATTALVLLIACSNLANLLLARASNREREIAVRLAIGASRWRIIGQLLAESLLLATFGAVLGGVLAQGLSRGLVAYLSTADSPLFVGLGIDWRILSFTAALALLTCVLFGLLPAIRATHLSPATAIRSGGRSVTAGRERFSLRRILVSTQVALSLVLLVGALLFVRSLRNLATIDAGFEPEGILIAELDLGRAKYTDEQRLAINRELQTRVSSIPGVHSAGQVWFTPVSGSGWNNDIGPDGTRAAGSGKDSQFNRVGPGYFKTMGISLLAGRDFDDRDTITAPAVAIVTEIFARKYFGGANPVGRTFRREADAGKPESLYQIVGMVENVKYRELREDFMPIAFLPMAQADDHSSDMSLVLRTSGSLRATLSNLTSAVAQVNPTIGIRFRSFSGQLEESLLRERLMATLSGAFGILAGLLSTLGLYGVIAYMVARRRGEIGVRMALGADRGRVIRLVLREALLLLAVGLTVGTVLALWAGRAAQALLFGLEPHDPVTIAAAIAVLTAVALVASYGPARRAASLQPTIALREE